jgi:hypothetical protein
MPTAPTTMKIDARSTVPSARSTAILVRSHPLMGTEIAGTLIRDAPVKRNL